MAEYWFQCAEGDPVEGPCTAAQLKALAAEGRITPTSMITGDGTTWHQAARIGKLFPPAQPAPPPPRAAAPRQFGPPPAPAAAHSPAAQVRPAPQPARRPAAGIPASNAAVAPPAYAPAAQPPVGLTYATPAGQSVAVGWVGKPRGTALFLVLSLVLLASNAAVAVSCYFDIMSGKLAFTRPALLFLASFLLGIGALVYWLVLVHAAHRDLRDFTGGTYKITPGQAVGFCFIPAFSVYWVVYMPWKLLSEVRVHLREGTSQASPGLVMGFQIASVPLGILFGPGAAALMYALTMTRIQKGLNALWRQGA